MSAPRTVSFPSLAALGAFLSATACGGAGDTMGGGYGLIGLVVFVLDIIAIVQVVQSGHSMVAKILWIIAILFLPILGMLLWFLLGRKK